MSIKQVIYQLCAFTFCGQYTWHCGFNVVINTIIHVILLNILKSSIRHPYQIAIRIFILYCLKIYHRLREGVKYLYLTAYYTSRYPKYSSRKCERSKVNITTCLFVFTDIFYPKVIINLSVVCRTHWNCQRITYSVYVVVELIDRYSQHLSRLSVYLILIQIKLFRNRLTSFVDMYTRETSQILNTIFYATIPLFGCNYIVVLTSHK